MRRWRITNAATTQPSNKTVATAIATIINIIVEESVVLDNGVETVAAIESCNEPVDCIGPTDATDDTETESEVDSAA